MKKTTVSNATLEALDLQELCRFCVVEEAWIIELVEHGALSPVGHSKSNWKFVGLNISRAKKACRLHRDLGVNAAGVALVLDLLEERDALLRRT